MKPIKLFFILLLSFFSIAHSSSIESTFEEHLDTIRKYVHSRHSESTEKADELKGEGPLFPTIVGNALWAIQRDIEISVVPKIATAVPKIERPLFTSLLSKVTMLMSFGDEISSESFWRQQFSI
jgi:hypothetical protein